jgi:hypothetical protein
MASENQEPNPLWDEYEWERFLQEQDKETERYLELLDKYGGNPQCSEMIAIEMGWPLNWDEEDFFDSGAVPCEEAAGLGEDAAGLASKGGGDPVPDQNPLYVRSVALVDWLEGALRRRARSPEGAAARCEIAAQVSVLSTFIRFSLCGEKDTEIGMIIAVLKRALRAANLALSASREAYRIGAIGRARHQYLRERIFELRDEIITEVGAARARLHALRDRSR